MRMLSRTGIPSRRVRLVLEPLERRLAPAVVNIDAAANVHAIDPNIYGSAFASTAQLADLGLPLNRNGGNASDTYSFVQDATNHANDWFFESIPLGTGNGQGMDAFVAATKAGGAQSSVTLNLFDWAAKLGANRSNLGSFSVAKYGPQQSTDPYNSNWGNGVHSNGSNLTGNDPSDAYLPNSPAIEQAWIQHLLATFGNAQTGGVKYYTLGNEPGLWDSTHRDVHPNGDTLPELRDRIISYASMVKALDPNAKILGPEEWGWTNYFISGADAAAQNWSATYDGLSAEAWLLDQLRRHDAATGQRLLDDFTLHFYPQGGQFSDDVSTSMELLRNRSTRSLWDPNYVDESWIASTGINGGKVNLINLMKSWVNSYYPGTKIGLTEYNWGAEGNMNGATTQADLWGIFGREGLDLANRWTTPATGSPAYLAMKLFRNYDGNGSAFGDTSVRAAVANPDQVDAFASIRSSDGALAILVVNKNLFDPNNPSARTPITINLANFAGGGTVQQWQLAAINPSNQTNAAITHLADLQASGTSFTVTVPQESVELFVLQPASQSPAPLTPNERFVQGLYKDFLGRTGAVAELDSWVAALPSVGRTGVASALAHSPEGLTRVVNSLYSRVLNRAADPGGLAAWVGALQRGMTEEQLTGVLLASPEFAGRANTLVGGTNADANFVQALYQLLLRRTAAAVEIQGWLPLVTASGRQTVAGAFLGSAEYRSDAIRTVYGDPSLSPSPWEPFFLNLLHRRQAPSAGDVAWWVRSPFDLLTQEVIVAGTQEYYDLQ